MSLIIMKKNKLIDYFSLANNNHIIYKQILKKLLDVRVCDGLGWKKVIILMMMHDFFQAVPIYNDNEEDDVYLWPEKTMTK